MPLHRATRAIIGVLLLVLSTTLVGADNLYYLDIGLNFTGSTLSDSGFIPPDTMGAVGNGHIVELINGRYAVYDKSDGSPITSSTLDDFWSTAGVTPANYAFDPRVIYDHDTERWFAVSVDNAGDPNDFLLAVSQSSDPTTGWTGFAIDSDSADGRWADFPTFGIDADGVYISANMFDAGLPGPPLSTTMTIVSVPKADLVGITPTLANMTIFENESATTRGFALQPVVDYGPSDGRAAFLAVDFDVFSQLNRTDVLDAETGSASLSSTVDISVPTTSSPPDADQPGTKDDLNTSDDRFGSSIYEVGDSLWAAHSITYDGNAAIRWYEIDEITNTVVQSGTISDSDLDFYYPSIAANEFGHVVMGFSGSSETQFVSSYAVLGETDGGITSFQDPILLWAGVDDYQILDGSGRNRWGDYSATVIDPEDPYTFWTFQEWVSAEDTWATRITQLDVAAIPEPGTIALFGLGLLGLGARLRRRKQS